MHDQDISGSQAPYDIVGEAKQALGIAIPAVQNAVARGALRPQAAQAMGALLQQGAVSVQPTGFGNRQLRRQICPLPITKVLKGTEALITLTPQRGFRVERLVLQSDAAGTSKCVVNSINVGATPQFVSDGSVPIQAFANVAISTSLRGDTASPGITITLRVQNLDAVNDETITGVFYGEAID